MRYELIKNSSRLFVTVEDDIIVEVYSPTHRCFNPIGMIGERWLPVKERYEAEGFLVHGGN